MLRTALTAELYDLDDIDEASWNPMLHNPGTALYALASRPFAPAADRLASARAATLGGPDVSWRRPASGWASCPARMSRRRSPSSTARWHSSTPLLPELAAAAGSALGAEADAARAAAGSSTRPGCAAHSTRPSATRGSARTGSAPSSRSPSTPTSSPRLCWPVPRTISTGLPRRSSMQPADSPRARPTLHRQSGPRRARPRRADRRDDPAAVP